MSPEPPREVHPLHQAVGYRGSTPQTRASLHVSPSLKLPETSDGVYGILLARLSCDQGQEKQQEGGRSGEEGQCTYTHSAVTVAAVFGV